MRVVRPERVRGGRPMGTGPASDEARLSDAGVWRSIRPFGREFARQILTVEGEELADGRQEPAVSEHSGSWVSSHRPRPGCERG